ncbi:hypothetical protein V2J09_011778 [Rumex salicifolius]
MEELKGRFKAEGCVDSLCNFMGEEDAIISVKKVKCERNVTFVSTKDELVGWTSLLFDNISWTAELHKWSIFRVCLVLLVPMIIFAECPKKDEMLMGSKEGNAI